MLQDRESGSDSARNGITVRSNDGIARTSTSVRPVSGMRSATPSAGSSVPPGSISTTISRPGCITAPGITAFAERARSPSSNSVGIVADWAGNVDDMRLGTVQEEAGADVRQTLGRGLVGSHEHPEQAVVARHQRHREVDRLDRLRHVRDRPLHGAAPGHLLVVQSGKPVQEYGLARRAQSGARQEEYVELTQRRERSRQGSLHVAIVREVECLQGCKFPQFGRNRSRQPVHLEQECPQTGEVRFPSELRRSGRSRGDPSVLRLERLPSSPGILPVSRFSRNDRYSRLARWPSSRGIRPLSVFHRRSRFVTLPRLPSVGGIVPPRRLAWRLRFPVAKARQAREAPRRSTRSGTGSAASGWRGCPARAGCDLSVGCC